MTNKEILNKVCNLKIGDKIRINGWTDYFTVCGVSEHFALAYLNNEYTIIGKEPVDYCYNGIPIGSIICGPDWWVMGWNEGYDFNNPPWIERYMKSLEDGETEISMRRRVKVDYMEVKNVR